MGYSFGYSGGGWAEIYVRMYSASIVFILLCLSSLFELSIFYIRVFIYILTVPLQLFRFMDFEGAFRVYNTNLLCCWINAL